MCQQQQKFTAKSSAVSVATGNSALNGTGAMTQAITGASDGTVIKSITVKATASNDQGMIRLFLAPGGGTKYLWKEIPVPANVQSAVVPAYQTTVRAGYTIQSGDELWASTQNTETWNILVEAVDWENCNCPA